METFDYSRNIDKPMNSAQISWNSTEGETRQTANRTGGRWSGRLGRAVGLVVSLATAAVAEEPGVADGMTPVNQFKRFVSSPPIVENLVFREITMLDPDIFATVPNLADVPTTFSRYYQVRWQPNAVLLRQFEGTTGTNAVESGGKFISVFGRDHSYRAYYPHITFWTNDLDEAGGDEPQFLDPMRRTLDTMREAMNLGIAQVDVGSIEWDGNHFAVENTIEPERIRRVAGELFEENGLPSRMEVSYWTDDRRIDWILRYHFEIPTGLPGIPSRVTKSHVTDGKETERKEWVILDLRVGDNELEYPAYDPMPYLLANKWQTRVYTNNALYSRLPTGELKWIPDRDQMMAIEKRRQRDTRMMIYATWLTANLGVFILLFRVRFGQNNH